ncbi:AAA family ATPase [Candidatus Albibeggiatoa sp. nov. NOAA]|uniref:AAA family ATPase n=1 Tax=Candidatus Albibeggiatoa sp. nov. NOAA TaxID=3162724 RepID=UPI0032FCE5BD|nr:AAA family ATPase [Thiotrichaceae bacterium]
MSQTHNISNYQIIEKIYESINSIVYRTIHNHDNLPVILKILKNDYPTTAEITRYHQEYSIISDLKDIEGIVNVYGLEKNKNTPVLCIEDFQGESLSYWLKKRIFKLEDQLMLAVIISKNIAHIHQQQIIHKDINPANIIWNPKTNIVKIIDFGISTQFSKQRLNLQNPEVLEGTLSYMSPEQTGRMNRAVDYRSDFYSLGVTLYELFTGQLPFATQDAMELVHSHLAKQPLAAVEINPNLPEMISNIISKLLSKTAEERYHSAWGIHADLQRCYDDLQNTGQIKPFELAQKDISDRFYIPQKLYGRDNEIKQLLAAFERVAQGTAEIMLVAGYSGIGKSVLVKEIYRALTKSNGYFIGGKFDQLQRNVPYSAIINAFKELVQQLLTENETQLNQWKQKLLTALRSNGQVIIDVIPEVEQIIGKQPAIPELSPAESQNRFNMVFQNFIQVFCHPDHPLVIFLDDLQWIDSATLKLLKLIAENKDNTALFIIGAYRDNEVSPAHPLVSTLEELREEQVAINQITLKPLAFEHVNQLVMDSVHQQDTTTLTDLVISKTQGNPFFINQFLHALYKENLLYFVPPTLEKNAYWQWDIQKIKDMNITDNVVDLMVSKLKQLPESAQQVLRLAACVGNHFDLDMLSIIYEKSTADTFQDLMPILIEEFILPSSSLELTDDDIQSPSLTIQHFRFLHDRVQEAAYALIDDEQKQTVHLQIGRLLLKNTSDETLEEKVFDIVNQFNKALTHVSHTEEKLKIAQLNLTAGEKAKESNAYILSYDYLQNAIDLIHNENPWQDHYELTLAIHCALAQLAFLTADFEQMDQYIDTVLNNAANTFDKLYAYEVRIQYLIAVAKPSEALQLGLEVLSLLDQNLSTELLEDIEIESLINLPIMQDAAKLATMRILNMIVAPSWISNPAINEQICLTMINLSYQYGNCDFSAMAYTSYGGILCGKMEVEKGYQFGKLGVELVDKLDAKQFKVRVYVWFYSTIKHWRKPVRETIEPYYKVFQLGIDTGDMEYACYALIEPDIYQFLMGTKLEKLVNKYADSRVTVQKLKQDFVYDFFAPYSQTLLNLLGQNGEKTAELDGDIFNKAELIPKFIEEEQSFLCRVAYLAQTVLAFIFRDCESAYQHALLTEKSKEDFGGMFLLAAHNFYCSLSLLSQIPCSESDTLLKQVNQNQVVLKQWAHHSPANFQHKYDLVEAEKARVLDQEWQAAKLYDKAIAGAQENQFINEEALAYELAAEFYLAQNMEKFAKIYLTDAHYAYQQWGAKAKVKDLEQRYPQLASVKPTEERSIHPTTAQTQMASTSMSSTQWLDLSSILKAAQTLSSEIVLERLLEKMMQVVMENAGADQGYLLLPKQDHWFIEAQTHLNQKTVTILQSLPVDEYLLAESVLHYVVRTQKPIVLDNAAQSEQFNHDAHILSEQTQSLLCMPLLNRGKLVGVLYLENNLIKGAFTPQRLEMLNLLSSQLAISIQNALFYAELEDKVAERTTELKQQTVALEQANESLVQLNQDKNEFLGIAAHDLKNPLAAIQGSAEYIQEEFDELPQEELLDSIQMIESASRKMFSLITNLLDVNAIESGKIKVNLQHVDILYVLKKVVNEYTKKAATKNISVHFTPEKNNYFAYVDPNTVHQILDNLISNAVKYSPLDKNVFIRITLQTDMIRIEIQDEGQGLSQADQAKLFGKFTRLSTKPTAGEHSTGLGLFIVKKLVNAMGGRVWCESELGYGATFILTVPSHSEAS